MRMLNIFYPDLVALINTARDFVLAAQKESAEEEGRGQGQAESERAGRWLLLLLRQRVAASEIKWK